jgi:hypothetical protein
VAAPSSSVTRQATQRRCQTQVGGCGGKPSDLPVVPRGTNRSCPGIPEPACPKSTYRWVQTEASACPLPFLFSPAEYALIHSTGRPSRHLADPTTWMVMSSLFRAPIWALCAELGLQFQPEIHFVSSVGSSENFVPWDRKFLIDSRQLNERIFRPTLYRHPSRLTLPDYVYCRYIEGLGF